MRTKTLDIEISKGTQSIIYTEILDIVGHKAKVEIKSDSYKSQCYAHMSIWDPTLSKWNELVRIHYGSMQTEEGLCYMPAYKPVGGGNFAADRNMLIKKALLIL